MSDNWLYLSLEELIDIEVNSKGEIIDESTNNDAPGDGITESGSEHSG